MMTVAVQRQAIHKSNKYFLNHSQRSLNCVLLQSTVYGMRKINTLPLGFPAFSLKALVNGLCDRWLHQINVSDDLWGKHDTQMLMELSAGKVFCKRHDEGTSITQSNNIQTSILNTYRTSEFLAKHELSYFSIKFNNYLIWVCPLWNHLNLWGPMFMVSKILLVCGHMGKSDPRNPWTSIPHEQCRFQRNLINQ